MLTRTLVYVKPNRFPWIRGSHEAPAGHLRHGFGAPQHPDRKGRPLLLSRTDFCLERIPVLDLAG